MAKNGQKNQDTKAKVMQAKEMKAKANNRKYGQGRAKHAKKGVYSCMIAGLILILLFVMLAISYVAAGETTALLGAGGIITLILAWLGLNLGIRGLREREKNYLTCKVGIWCNMILLVVFIVIFIRGMI